MRKLLRLHSKGKASAESSSSNTAQPEKHVPSQERIDSKTSSDDGQAPPRSLAPSQGTGARKQSSLWDRAYDAFAASNGAVADKYEKLLSSQLSGPSRY